jgi:hypothetical protein
LALGDNEGLVKTKYFEGKGEFSCRNLAEDL